MSESERLRRLIEQPRTLRERAEQLRAQSEALCRRMRHASKRRSTKSLLDHFKVGSVGVTARSGFAFREKSLLASLNPARIETPFHTMSRSQRGLVPSKLSRSINKRGPSREEV
jgi:hypothetical protein